MGLLSSSTQAISPGPLHYRALQRLKSAGQRKGIWYSDHIPLSPEAQADLLWWQNNLDSWNGKAIFGNTPDHILESDASNLGRLGSLETGGKWSQEELSLHINSLEMMVSLNALMSFKSILKNSVVLIKLDNFTAISYINRLGGERGLCR